MRRTYGRKTWERDIPLPSAEKPIFSAAGRVSKLANCAYGLFSSSTTIEQSRRFKEAARKYNISRYWTKHTAWG